MMSIPNLFPLPSAHLYAFAQDGKMQFGWAESGFYIRAGNHTLRSFVLTEDGWKAAWELMSSKYPQLANKVASAVERTVLGRAAAEAIRRNMPMFKDMTSPLYPMS
jgi:hypothetical protein